MAAAAGGSIAVSGCPSCSYFSHKSSTPTSTILTTLAINPVNQRRSMPCLAVQESSTSTVEPVAAETEEKKEAAKAKAKPAGKAPAKPLPELMEEDVIPSLRETLEAQQDLSDLQLFFDQNKLEGSFLKKGNPYTFWAFFPEGINVSLKPELFEGMRFDFTKGLNQKFSLSHSVMMGPTEVPSQSSETIKIPTANYEFGANFIDPKLMLFGRVMTDGRLSARLKCDLTDNLTLKGNAQITSEPHMSHGVFNFDYKGSDYRAQFQMGNGALLGASYIQSVTPHLSFGGEVFWAGQHRKSGLGYAARYNTDKMVATGQVASTGMIALSYVQKVSEKVALASDFMYNYMSREVTSSFGYDYMLRQCRLRGKIDSNGVVAAFLEERFNMGLNFILSAEIDHRKKDYKFGFGLTVGE
ncbi:translocase of the outer mitochondrial membrane 40 [Perilla frutescens var. frutescens]|nr:translocase of the outer mitochondrial membrane 40 [Perilla frutescens var. frutescens]